MRFLMAACWLAVSFCAAYNGEEMEVLLYHGVRFILMNVIYLFVELTILTVTFQ